MTMRVPVAAVNRATHMFLARGLGYQDADVE